MVMCIWFYQKDKEVQRLRKALEEARTRDLTRSLKGSNKERPVSGKSSEQSEDTTPIVLEDSVIKVPKYKKANIVVGVNYEPHERPIHEVVEILCQIVGVEGPVHSEEIARRYASAHGKSRLGSRISDHVQTALSRAQRDQRLERKGLFWGTQEQFLNIPVRDRSNETVPTTSAENISSMEILACADLIEQESGSVEAEELVRVIAKTLGFKRAGPEFQAHVRACLKDRNDPSL